MVVHLYFGERSAGSDIEERSSEGSDPLAEGVSATLESIRRQLEEGSGKVETPPPPEGILGASTAVSQGGATPVRSGTEPSGQTLPEEALAMRLLRFTGDGSLVLLAATVAVSALIEAAEPKPRGLFSRLFSD